MAGEIGHTLVNPGGEPCGCGQRGCLERYCSATYLAELTMRAIRQGQPSSLKAVMDARGAINTQDINEARKAGDALAARFWDDAARHLALACVNICRVFDPDEIVLSGGLSKAGEDLLGPVRKHFDAMNWTLMPNQTRIALASLGNNAGVIGAAGVAWRASRQ